MSHPAASFPKGGRTPGTGKYGTNAPGGRSGWTSRGAGVRFDVQGLERIQDRLDRLHGDVVEEMGEALSDELWAVYDESQALCPIDTGFLRSTGYVEFAKDREGFWRGAVGYRAFYAVFVHERLDIGHKAPTQAKFLETAWARRKGGVAAAVGRAAQAALRG